MDSNKIESFLALAELLSFTKTAEKLSMSQSVLSRKIQSLEEELGMELLNRNSKYVSLTPAGLVMSEGLRDMQLRYNATVERALAAQKGYSGEIRIGILNGISLAGFRPILMDYEQLHPGVKFVLFSDSLRNLRQMLLDKTMDFVLGLRDDFEYIPKISVKLVYQIPTSLVVSKSHRLALQNGAELHLRDFKDDTFLIMPEKESAALRSLVRLCSSEGFSPVVSVAPDLPTILLRVEAGHGVALLSESNTSFGNPMLAYLRLSEFNPMRFCAIWFTENIKAANQAFIDYLDKTIP